MAPRGFCGGRGDLGAVRAVLLDMDGTLVDSDRAVERAWQSWSTEYGVDVETALAIAHGSPADHTVRRLLPELDEQGVAEAAARQLACQYDDLSDVGPTDGAHELVDVIRRLGLPWAVVTSADRRLAAARLGATAITPPVLITRDDVHHGKPHPACFLQAAQRLGVPPDECLVVEDAEAGCDRRPCRRCRGRCVEGAQRRHGDRRPRSARRLAVDIAPLPPFDPMNGQVRTSTPR